MSKCPQCGYEENVTHKRHTDVMSEYVNAKGQTGVFNDNAERITSGTTKENQVEWVRKDIADKAKSSPAPKVAVTPAPATK